MDKEIRSINLSDKPDINYTFIDEISRNDIKSKQDKLVSGINIKTINNQDILGKGNIEIKENSGITPEQLQQIETNKNNIVELEKNKQDKLISGTNIKTINNQSIIGEGNIEIKEKTKEQNLLNEAKNFITRNQYQLCNQNLPIQSEKDIDLILFAGQSNSCGRAQLEDATSPLDVFVQVDENVGFDVSNGGAGGKKPIIEPISLNASSGYGYIPSFINAYNKATGRTVCACYLSLGATMLNKFMPYTYDESGNKQLDKPGAQFPGMCNAINWSKGSPHLKNKLGHIYMVWCQGESDGDYYGTNNSKCNSVEKELKTFRQKVDYYKTSFTDMFNVLKTKTGLEKAFIIRIGHQNLSKPNIKPETKFNYLPIIQAQNELGRDNPDIAIVSTVFAGAQFFEENDNTVRNLMRDEWHYLPEGYVRAGLEAGVNAGIFVNSQYTVKPTLVEYNQIYLDRVPGFTEFSNIYYENPIDKYIYNPNRIDMQFMMDSVKDKVNKISCTPKETVLKPGDTVQIETTFIPGNVSNKKLTYSTSAENTAKVSESGLITAGNITGDAIVSVTSQDNSSATDTITVHVKLETTNISSINIQETHVELDKGENKQITVTVEPEINDDLLQWKVEPSVVASVTSGGLITANDYGDATITAYSRNNPSIKDICTIHVANSTPVPPKKSLTIDSVGKNEVGEILTLTVNSEGNLINDAQLSITSGNENAILEGNKLTLNKPGQVTIKATKAGYEDGTLIIIIQEQLTNVIVDFDFTNKSMEQYIEEGKLKKVNSSDVLPKHLPNQGLVFDISTKMPNGIQLATPATPSDTLQIDIECSMPDAPNGEADTAQNKNKYRSFAIVTGSRVASEPNTTDFSPAVYTMPNGTLEFRHESNKADKSAFGGIVGQKNQIFLYDEQLHKYKILLNKTDKAYPHQNEAYRDDELIAYGYIPKPKTVLGNFEYLFGASDGYQWGISFAWQPKSVIKKIKITKLEK